MGYRINWSTRNEGVGTKKKKVAGAGAAAVGNSFEKSIRLKKAGQYVYFSLSNHFHRCKRVGSCYQVNCTDANGLVVIFIIKTMNANEKP